MEQRSGSISVTPLEPCHADPLATMMGQRAAFHDDVALTTAADVVRQAAGPDRISTIAVASLGGEPCGFAATYDWMNYIHGFPIRHIDLFFVREDARGRGVGCALLRWTAREAGRGGCRRVTVGAEPDNAGANAFYRRMGFELRVPATNRYALSGTALEGLAA